MNKILAIALFALFFAQITYQENTECSEDGYYDLLVPYPGSTGAADDNPVQCKQCSKYYKTCDVSEAWNNVPQDAFPTDIWTADEDIFGIWWKCDGSSGYFGQAFYWNPET